MTEEERIQFLSERLARICLHSASLNAEYIACKDLWKNPKLNDIVRRANQCYQRLESELKLFAINSKSAVNELFAMGNGEAMYLTSEILDEIIPLKENNKEFLLTVIKEWKAGNLIIENVGEEQPA